MRAVTFNNMSTQIAVIDALARASSAGESVVLATVVRVTGSSYGGVGARMVIRVDGTSVGIVSGGCLESDLAEHAIRVHATRRAETVSYDTRNDDDAVWGLGLGCNGLIDVLLTPLDPKEAAAVANLLRTAIESLEPSILATVVGVPDTSRIATTVGSHALWIDDRATCTGTFDANLLAEMSSSRKEALTEGRRGLWREHDGIQISFEVVMPVTRLVVCGSGPDALPVARMAAQLGWDVTVVDHRPPGSIHAERFPDARVVDCPDARSLGEAVSLTPRTAGVVMAHNFARDTDYVESLLRSGIAYIGVLGPRARTERMLAELRSRNVDADGESLFAPVGLDVGGDGPDAIALAVISEVSAVMNDRRGGHLRDRREPLHSTVVSRARVT